MLLWLGWCVSEMMRVAAYHTPAYIFLSQALQDQGRTVTTAVQLIHIYKTHNSSLGWDTSAVHELYSNVAR